MSRKTSGRIPGGDSLVIRGEYNALSDPDSGVWDVSRATRFGFGPDVAAGVGCIKSDVGSSFLVSGTSVFEDDGSSVAGGLAGGFFWSLS